jgi:hypothetical protein
VGERAAPGVSTSNLSRGGGEQPPVAACWCCICCAACCCGDGNAVAAPRQSTALTSVTHPHVVTSTCIFTEQGQTTAPCPRWPLKE